MQLYVCCLERRCDCVRRMRIVICAMLRCDTRDAFHLRPQPAFAAVLGPARRGAARRYPRSSFDRISSLSFAHRPSFSRTPDSPQQQPAPQPPSNSTPKPSVPAQSTPATAKNKVNCLRGPRSRRKTQTQSSCGFVWLSLNPKYSR